MPIAARSLEIWRATTAEDSALPATMVPLDATHWFTSLGNGHFTQALNLFRQQKKSVFTGEPVTHTLDRLNGATFEHLDSRCVLLPSPWVLWRKHVSNPA